MTIANKLSDKCTITKELWSIYFDSEVMIDLRTGKHIETGAKNMKIKLECPDCGETFEHKGRYDVDMDKQVVCPHCKFTVSKWVFELVESGEEEEE